MLLKVVLASVIFAYLPIHADVYASTKLACSKAKRMPVLVELFTSEGCANCPPAEAVLAILSNGQPVANAEIITLAFHVDYWNGQGWKDPYSSPLFTQRQEIYKRSLKIASSYTPQMVVDGHLELMGSDLAKANRAILKAAGIEKGVADVSKAGGLISVVVSDVSAHKGATVYLAITENGLNSDISSGENRGRSLQHSSVVRELTTLGFIGKGETTFEASTVVEPRLDWKHENLSFVVFVQENAGRRILAVGKTSGHQRQS